MNDNFHPAFLLDPSRAARERTLAGIAGASIAGPLSVAIPQAVRLPALALAGKRLLDIVCSLVLLVLVSPLLLAAAIAVACSGGPVLFAQQRLGLNGRVFNCYKFRSMVVDADAALEQLLERDPEARAEWARAQKLTHDPRITRVGAILRKTSIDELPQLWNVLRGDMSLVGPRPIMPHQLGRYGRSAKWYMAMRPGITGLWQVTARGDANFSRRVSLDCSYVRRYRFLLDLVLLVRTVSVVISGRGAM